MDIGSLRHSLFGGRSFLDHEQVGGTPFVALKAPQFLAQFVHLSSPI